MRRDGAALYEGGAGDGYAIGKPVIKGTRIAVEFVLELLAEGWTREPIVGNHPSLTAEDLRAALHYAAEALKRERGAPFAV